MLYLPEICEWYQSENFDSWWINVVWTPDYCINNLTQSARELVLNKLTRFDFGQHQTQIDVIISMIQSSKPIENPTFVETIKNIDLLRHQDLRLSHQEIAEAMNYVL